MKKLHSLTLGAALAVGVTFPALAVEPPPQGSGAPAQKHVGAGMAKPSAIQTVRGTVTEINQSTGSLALTAPDGSNLQLHFPAAAIHDLKRGDEITARFALVKAAGPSRSYDAPMGRGEHRMSGTVQSVDQQSGWLRVKADQTILALRFPPRALTDLKAGDSITVQLAFSRES
jgi:hypothetical protein